MSKVSQFAESSWKNGIESKSDAVSHAKFVLSGKRTITRDEAVKLFGEAADILDVQFKRMVLNLGAIIAAEIEVAEKARGLISSSKDIAGKIGDAMARIDKVVVSDFERKLDHLERFVAAMKELDRLKQSGTLDAFVSLMAKKQ
jgi:glutamate dehydrogenase/leucine dehydrogenase